MKEWVIIQDAIEEERERAEEERKRAEKERKRAEEAEKKLLIALDEIEKLKKANNML